MSNEVEKELLEDAKHKKEIEKGQEYLKNRKAARAHFHKMRKKNALLNKDSTKDTAEEMIKEIGIDNGGE